MEEWSVNDGENGLSGLAFLQARLPQAPKGYLRQLLRRGRIACNGRPLAEHDALRSGDRIRLPASRRLQELVDLPSTAVHILCETREGLIAEKPAGLAVHRGAGHEEDHLAARVEALLRGRGQTFRCAPIHRLDAATSGPVLFGKGRQAIATFGKVFMSEPVTKLYLALVAGRPPDRGWLTAPVPVRGKERHCATGFRSLAGSEDYALLELQLLTGRRHQIRRQLAVAGHPIAGDQRYGGPALPGLERLFLHCCELRVPDPYNGGELIGHCPLPPELHSVLKGLRIAPPETILFPNDPPAAP